MPDLKVGQGPFQLENQRQLNFFTFAGFEKQATKGLQLQGNSASNQKSLEMGPSLVKSPGEHETWLTA